MPKFEKIKILIASKNKGKVNEISSILADKFEVLSIDSITPGLPDYIEDGAAFIENAEGKALFYNKLAGLPTLADDSGLSVDALEGAPGVKSARWAGDDADDTARIDKILSEMAIVPNGSRTAAFICVAAFADLGKIVKTVQGKVEGEISRSPAGSSGFGYDPVFYYPALKKTFAELSTSEKNQVSHRGLAFKKIRDFLLKYFHTSYKK